MQIMQAKGQPIRRHLRLPAAVAAPAAACEMAPAQAAAVAPTVMRRKQFLKTHA